VEEQFHTFFTSALNSGQWLFAQPGRFTPEERTAGFTEQETGWAPQPHWAPWRIENSSAPYGNRTAICRSFSPYSGHHTDWACPAPNKNGLSTEKYECVESKFHHLFVLNWSCGISGLWCGVLVCACVHLHCTQMYAALPAFGVQCVLCWLKILNSVACGLAIRRTFWCFSSHNNTNKYIYIYIYIYIYTHMSHLFITHYLQDS
jgi:hypothetical protein